MLALPNFLPPTPEKPLPPDWADGRARHNQHRGDLISPYFWPAIRDTIAAFWTQVWLTAMVMGIAYLIAWLLHHA